MKRIMNDIQTVKSAKAYRDMTEKQKVRTNRESGLMLIYIFVPLLLLIPCYYILSKTAFENASYILGTLSVIGLFVGLYKIAKQREANEEDGGTILFSLKFLFAIFSFGILWNIHWILGIVFVAVIIWYIRMYFTDMFKFETYTREITGTLVDIKVSSSQASFGGHILVTPVFNVKNKLYPDMNYFIDRNKNKILYYGKRTEEQVKEQDEYTDKVYTEAEKHFLELTHLELGKTYTLKQHPIMRSWVTYCSQLTDHIVEGHLMDEKGAQIYKEEFKEEK